MALQMLKWITNFNTAGCWAQNLYPVTISPKQADMMTATMHIEIFVKSIKSYGLGVRPTRLISAFKRFWTPPVTPSMMSDNRMKRRPSDDDWGPPDCNHNENYNSLVAAYKSTMILWPCCIHKKTQNCKWDQEDKGTQVTHTFFPKLKTAVPPMIAATCRYSRMV